MPDSAQPGSKARFGVFELDLASGELRKSGVKVRLQEQPFQVLKALAERPGEVVSREELQHRLWPDETFVDFEDGLSTAVRKIRQALGDSASSPRFIETLPKRGYRFVAPVDQPLEPDATKRIPPVPPRRGLAWAVVAAAGAVALAWMLATPSAPPLEATIEPLQAAPLTSLPGDEVTPEFSPDGSQVAFAWAASEDEDLDIYVKVVGESEPIQLTDNPADDFGPAWSPDGKWIAFGRRNLSSGMIATILLPALGGGEREIHIHPDLSPRVAVRLYDWALDSEWLIAPKGGLERERGFALIPRRGGVPRDLTKPPRTAGAATWDKRPAVSPDGQQLAFMRCVGAGCHLFVGPLAAAGLTEAEVRQLTSGSSVRDVAWSPDGRDVIYEHSFLSPRLSRIPADGSAPARLLGVNGGHLAVSPASLRLAYASGRVRADIWLQPLSNPGQAGGPPERVVASSVVDTQPDFSPAGNRIAFSSTSSGSTEIWVADVDGSKPTRLTEFDGPQTGTPRFSPNGERLLFNSMVAGNREVFVLDQLSGAPRRLTNTPAEDTLPSWSHDGLWIYFTSDRTKVRQIWKIPSEGGKAVQLTQNGGSSGLESHDGEYFYYINQGGEPARNGWGQIWRVPSQGGDEEIVFAGSAHTHRLAIGDAGLYYHPAAPADGPWSIDYLDFSTGQTRTVVDLGREPFSGLSLSPDGRSLLYSRVESRESDLMLVEDFE